MASKSSLNDEIRELDAAAEVDSATDPRAARKKAMDLLARREHAGDELERKLTKAGFDPDTAADAVAQLADEGLQSDERFIEAFVQSRIRQGKGPQRIRADLRDRGVAAATIAAALEAAGADWVDIAADVRRRKFGDGPPADFKEKARQMRFLAYRGFETEHIQRIFKR